VKYEHDLYILFIKNRSLRVNWAQGQLYTLQNAGQGSSDTAVQLLTVKRRVIAKNHIKYITKGFKGNLIDFLFSYTFQLHIFMRHFVTSLFFTTNSS
jgi:hypothetical protein